MDLEKSDFLVGVTHQLKDEWKSVSTTYGAAFVMIHGTYWMQRLLATSLDTVLLVFHNILHIVIVSFHAILFPCRCQCRTGSYVWPRSRRHLAG